MNSLLISLGTSPAIVPEAFLLPGVTFCAVHVLTTERPDVNLVQEFFKMHAPQVSLHITRVSGFHDFTSEADHFRFEEVMYRWFLDIGIQPEDRYVCLSGGFKTMSAAMQKAAAVLGTAEVFHVLADNCCTDTDGKPRPPNTAEEVLTAAQAGKLHWIRLGPESGWPQLRSTALHEYPLTITREEQGVRWARTADDRFRRRLREIVERSHRIAGTWEQIPDLPFAELATWSEADLAWLRQPLEPHTTADQDWVKKLPKIELHLHLGGFATHGDELREVRVAAEKPQDLPELVEPTPPPGWPLPPKPVSLADYMRLGNATGSNLLADPGCLRTQCALLYQHLLEQNVLYAEVRCSPANYALPGRSPWQVLADIKAAFDAAMQASCSTPDAQPACHVNLILIATRREQGDYRATIARHLALAVTAAEHWTDESTCRVVGVDLAGYEDVTTRAHYFREEFTAIHRCGLALTVHAGENDDAEGIWRAVFDLNARRLGHALSLAQAPELLRSVTDRGIGLEMCPYANYQIRGFPLDPPRPSHPSVYPLLAYLNAGARVTVNTDNPGISAASLTDNLLLAARLCPGLTRLHLLHLQRNACDTAFCSATRRTKLAERLSLNIPKP